MTPNNVINEVRWLVEDTKTPYRYSDELLLGFVNQTFKRIALIRPDLFAVVADIATVPGTVLQTCPADSIRLVEIFQVKGGNSVTEVSRTTLNQTTPGWQQEASGQPVNFMRHVRNPNQFFVYPAPEAGVVLIGEYVQTPPDYTLSQVVTFPVDAYFPSVVDGVVFLAESVDNEHVNSNRAKLFQDSFLQGFGVSLQSRALTDIKAAGEDSKQVI